MSYLHFTFGPVQGFVSQARRTRDLWAGSYLLSYLSGCAMAALADAAERKGYKGQLFVVPEVAEDTLYKAIARGTELNQSDSATWVGSLPNRFKAIVPEGIDGTVCSQEIADKWKAIAQQVRKELDVILANAGFDASILDTIWNRQIPHHWECSWVISDDDTALDIRKNLRNHCLQSEPGEKCTICGERQEILGFEMGMGKQRSEMSKKWNALRNSLDEQGKVRGATLFDVKQNERLCSVCLVKRAFPFRAIAEEVIGWEVPVNYPSTHYMSAIDWIIRVFKECKDEKSSQVKDAVNKFVEKANNAELWYSEMKAGIKGVEKSGKDSGLDETTRITFAALDGGAFFKSVISNEKEFEVEGSEENRKALLEALKSLQNTLPPKRGESREAIPFYALLLMDGDGMGKLLVDFKEEQSTISKALAQFTQDASTIVSDCNGRLIYAGGDDVFALLPMDKAIQCAKLCRDSYQNAFKETAPTIPAERITISAAIQYAHMLTPLSVVVKDAHHLLDIVAKEECGRDGLACRVWKRGGAILTWAQPWKIVTGEALSCSLKPNNTLLDEVCDMFQDSQNDPTQFSSKFFYKMRDIFEFIAPEGQSVMDDEAIHKILATEYLANREQKWPGDPSDKDKRMLAEQRVARLVNLCKQHQRDEKGNVYPTENGLSADGALLVRFLVQKEV